MINSKTKYIGDPKTEHSKTGIIRNPDVFEIQISNVFDKMTAILLITIQKTGHFAFRFRMVGHYHSKSERHSKTEPWPTFENQTCPVFGSPLYCEAESICQVETNSKNLYQFDGRMLIKWGLSVELVRYSNC